MRLRTSLTFYSTAFFATLGLAPLTACGGTTFGTASGTQNSDSGVGGSSNETGGGAGRATGGGNQGGGGAGGGGQGNGGQGGYGAGGWEAGGASPGGFGGASTGGYVSADGGTAHSSVVCRNPQARLVNGQATGFVDCEGGSSYRTEKRDCPSLVPRVGVECKSTYTIPDAGGPLGSCKTDADCTERPNGMCMLPSGNALPACSCSYGCIRDEDCGAGKICMCGNAIGHCVEATNCMTGRDCAAGFACLSYVVNPGCGGTAFACQTNADNCVNDGDCLAGSQCSLIDGAHQCQQIMCAAGRPFLVAGEARVAGLSARTDWCSEVVPGLEGLGAATRAMLADRWTEIALMEHASIAAFARFSLELLSLGAPPELLVASQSAMADETRHARDAFALASAYAGAPVGPGPLAIDTALTSRGSLEIVRTAILEGCIGETVAAVEAAEALAHATDEAVRSVLARVAEEERRHAELAWRFVKWILTEGAPELSRTVRTELVTLVEGQLSAASQDGDAPRASADPSVLAHGILPESTRTELRRRVLSEVILPCARALADDSRRLGRNTNIVGSAGMPVGAV